MIKQYFTNLSTNDNKNKKNKGKNVAQLLKKRYN